MIVNIYETLILEKSFITMNHLYEIQTKKFKPLFKTDQSSTGPLSPKP